MKDRIVIKDEIFADFLIKNKDNHNISASPKVIMDRCRVEQEPTNWEELKELCENIKGVEYAGGNAKGEIIQLDNIWFAENGDIWGYSENWEEVCVIGKNKTPQQMWGIIKNLRGE